MNLQTVRSVLQHRARQLGAVIAELAVVAPMMAIMGPGTVQYGQLFVAKNYPTMLPQAAHQPGLGNGGNPSNPSDLVARTEECAGMTGTALQNMLRAKRRVVVDLKPEGRHAPHLTGRRQQLHVPARPGQPGAGQQRRSRQRRHDHSL